MYKDTFSIAKVHPSKINTELARLKYLCIDIYKSSLVERRRKYTQFHKEMHNKRTKSMTAVFTEDRRRLKFTK